MRYGFSVNTHRKILEKVFPKKLSKYYFYISKKDFLFSF